MSIAASSAYRVNERVYIAALSRSTAPAFTTRAAESSPDRHAAVWAQSP